MTLSKRVPESMLSVESSTEMMDGWVLSMVTVLGDRTAELLYSSELPALSLALKSEKLTKPESLEDALAEWEEVRHTVGKFIVQRGRDLGSYLAGDDAEDPPEIGEIMANSALRVTDIPDYPLK